jgi:hypothetical protein
MRATSRAALVALVALVGGADDLAKLIDSGALQRLLA